MNAIAIGGPKHGELIHIANYDSWSCHELNEDMTIKEHLYTLRKIEYCGGATRLAGYVWVYDSLKDADETEVAKMTVAELLKQAADK